jgi:alkylation response protein AidB-like acyl-CoA dehydrogenase
MSWDFETDPEFQQRLDWVENFVREEVEPLDYVIGHPMNMADPVRRELIPPLQEKVRAQGLWGFHLSRELGGQGYGQVKNALLNEILGRARCAPVVFGNQAPDSGNAEIIAHYGTDGTEEAVPAAAARQRDRLLLRDDRAAGRRGPEGTQDQRGRWTATSGSSAARSGSRRTPGTRRCSSSWW